MVVKLVLRKPSMNFESSRREYLRHRNQCLLIEYSRDQFNNRVKNNGMDQTIPNIYCRSSTSSFDDIIGCSSDKLQQLLMAAYSPRISVVSSELADNIAARFGDVTHVYQLFTYLENILAFGFKCNQKLNFDRNRNASQLLGSGSVRFVDDVYGKHVSSEKVEELFSLNMFQEQVESYVANIDNEISNVVGSEFNDEMYRSKYNQITKLQNSVYIKIHSMMYQSQSLTSFESFSHPIAQLAVVSGFDTIENILSHVTDIERTKLPPWIDISAILQHIMILVDKNDHEMLQNALNLQEKLKVKYGKTSSIVPLDLENQSDQNIIELYPSVLNTHDDAKVEEKHYNTSIKLSKDAVEAWSRPLRELIDKDLITFMNSKIRLWTEQIVQPRTSITGRLFGSKKWSAPTKSGFFSFGSGTPEPKETEAVIKNNFNVDGGYYEAQSAEMILRRLGDWYFILGDYKNAQSTYELVKKDLINDKAYSHLAALHESSVSAQLLNAVNDSNYVLTSKTITNIIRPIIDSAFYTYLSRSNLKSYTIRMTITLAELYLLLGQKLLSKTQLTDSLIELCFNESIALLRKIIDSKLVSPLVNSYLMQRISCVYASYSATKHFSYQGIDDPYYIEENPMKKIVLNPKMESIGLMRERKQIMWLLLAAKEMNPQKQHLQTKLIVHKVQDTLADDVINKSSHIQDSNKDHLWGKIQELAAENV